jgi:serine/threonine protein kinase
VQGDKCVILVEFANGGSLLDFFKANNVPADLKEGHQLWKDISNIFVGLVILHNGKRTVGVHQDLKPANIFVFKKPDKDYEFDFKLGDFGLCSVTEVDPARETFCPDNHATKMYSAPELCCTERDLQGRYKGVTWEADIWSLGCILLEAGIWMHLADRGRQKFLEDRRAATVSLTKFCSAGYQGAFHDGRKALDIIHDIPGKFADGSDRERLTSSIMNFIVREMLLGEEGKRLDAEQLKTRFDDVIDSYLRPNRQSVLRIQTELKPRTSSTSLLGNGVSAEDKRNRPMISAPVITETPWQHHTIGPVVAQRPFEVPERAYSPEQSDKGKSPLRLSSSPLAPSSERSDPSPTAGVNSTSASQQDSTTPQDRAPMTQFFSNHPLVTIPEVHDWISQHKRDKSNKLKGMDEVLKYVSNRDQVSCTHSFRG